MSHHKMNNPKNQLTSLTTTKQYYIDQCCKFMVVESKTNRQVAHCIHYDSACQQRLRTSFSKFRHQ